MLDQMFQDCLDRRIIPSVQSAISMMVLQLHGIPGWAAPAGGTSPAGARARRDDRISRGYSTRRVDAARNLDFVDDSSGVPASRCGPWAVGSRRLADRLFNVLDRVRRDRFDLRHRDGPLVHALGLPARTRCTVDRGRHRRRQPLPAARLAHHHGIQGLARGLAARGRLRCRR